MTTAPAQRLEPLSKERLGLSLRAAPELFESTRDLHTSSHGDAIRVALHDLALSAVFCVQGVPTAAIWHVESYDPSSVMRVHAALWNQGLASILIVMHADCVRVFSLGRAPVRGDQEQFERRTLIEIINTATDALAAASLITGVESGRYLDQHKAYFKPEERVDSVLLSNLLFCYRALVDDGLTDEAAQAALLQTMFIAYLEDRQAIGRDYFSDISDGKRETFSELLEVGDRESLRNLFAALRRDFKGDLFISPNSLDNLIHVAPLGKEDLWLLARFREGVIEFRQHGSQLRFWGYDFRYMPVELISAVYDRFIGERAEKRRDDGAYYTPMFLADSVVLNAWDFVDAEKLESGVFLDPACGSGVFLVSVLQRLCSHWRTVNAERDIPWDVLLHMVSRVHGWDINGASVRIAAFSLYLALLEEVDPPDLKRLAASGRELPSLLNHSLLIRDFFDDNFIGAENSRKFDVIIGNPPWTSRRAHNRLSITWCRSRGLPNPNNEDSWAFVWKSLEHLRTSGVVAFLLPAMGFLHAVSDASLAARDYLFRATRVRRIINFADLRFLLFGGAIRPAALIVFGPPDPNANNADVPTMRGADEEGAATWNYKFDYWAPKADLNAALRRAITLSTADRCIITAKTALSNPMIFKHRLWMGEPEARLFRYLASLPRLARFVKSYKGTQGSSFAGEDDSWVIGQGYQPARPERINSPGYRSFLSEYVGRLPDLPIKSFHRFWQAADRLRPMDSCFVRRGGFEPGFSGPRVIVPRGVETSIMRLRAAFADEAFTCQDIFQTITVPSSDTRRAKVLTAILNSKLAVWYAFQGTSSFGSERPEVKLGELLSFPFPEPSDIPQTRRSEVARDKLIKLIDEARRRPDFGDTEWESERLSRIDALVYDYYGLSDEEIMIVDDGVRFIIPASQPARGSVRLSWRPSTRPQREAYARTLLAALAPWFSEDSRLAARLEASNADVAILSVCLDPGEGTADYDERQDSTLSFAISRLAEVGSASVGGNVHVHPNRRIFANQCVYLIKPTHARFWLRSTALTDAEGIAKDIQLSADLQSYGR